MDVFSLSAIRDLPALAVVGSLVMPLTVVFLFWELNTPRNISFPTVLILVLLGGAVSLYVSFIGFSVGNLGWLKASEAGIIEETGKLLAVILVVRNLKYKYMLNGLVFGAAIGAGFAAFETAGYGQVDGFFETFLRSEYGTLKQYLDAGQMGDFMNGLAAFLNDESLPKWIAQAEFRGIDALITIVHHRSYDAPITHIAWTAIAACALWRVKGDQKFRFNMLLDPTFLRTFAVSVGCHMLWNSPFFNYEGLLSWVKPIVLGVIAWYVIFGLTQQGLRQVRDMQRSQTEKDYRRTQEILTTSGRFRAQRPA
jgi:RsiW-degrading membrane proteinase PrsW (M82 family)